MIFHVITLFPDSFSSYLSDSILARAKKQKIIDWKFYNPRHFVKPTRKQSTNPKPYLRVDDKPYGGGPGMVIQAEPILRALTKIKKNISSNKKNRVRIIHLSPQGKLFSNQYASNLANKFDHLIIICGRYEGVDQRVKKIFKGDDLSVGDYILTGGELPAMIIIDVVSRHLEGVLGNFESIEEKRVHSAEVYTRPEVINFQGKKYKVPKVLLSGNHGKIDKWRDSRNKKMK